MSAAASDPLIQLAERVSAVAAELGISTALIGAAALAARNYVRGTTDIDRKRSTNPM